MEDLKRSAAALAPIPAAAAREYRAKMATLREHADRELADYLAIEVLIGFNPVEAMYDQHRYHASFMANVLHFNAFELLAGTVVWVYQTYHAHGFSYDYFLLEVKAWMRAVAKHLEAASAQAVNSVYLWWMSHHEDLIALSRGDLTILLSLDPSLDQEQEEFLPMLLQGEYRECLHLADGIVTSPETLMNFYLQVIQPCLYQVGNLWQRGVISVAQEHLASTVVARVMAATYARVEPMNPLKGRAVVTAAPNNFHDIGARMLADCLSLDGWETDYLGANMPQSDLLGFLAGSPPSLVAISLAIPCNLMETEEIVKGIKSHPYLKDARILVGGGLFLAYPELWHATGADGWAPDPKAAVALAHQWWEAR
ncbi:MAG: cobalamin B12-binding domain-containing protein [Desulfobaccales bacterium]